MRYLLLATVLLLPASGLAQKDPPRTQLFIMDPAEIMAQGIKVPVIYIDADQRVKFDRLMKLKKDFLPKLKATAKAETLR